jgi:hypothetical protein
MKHLCEHCPLQPPKVLCVECAKPFRPDNRRRKRHFCSPECREQWQARRQLKYRKAYQQRKAQAANGSEPPKAITA